jgi:PAS domain S-box-containing protein
VQQRDDTARKLKIDDLQKLRKKAEARAARAPPTAKPHQSTAALLHDLRVHQIELEMQNEELRRSQLELNEARERYVDLYDFAPVGYVTLDEKGVIVRANLTAATLLGVERGTLLGRPFPGLVTREDGDRWHLAFVALLRGDERAMHRLTLTRGDGATFDADVVCERRSGRDGNQVHIVLTDITEFGRMERELRETEALRESEERLRAFFQSPAVGIAITSGGKSFLEVNDCFCAMLGYTRDELLRVDWRELTHPDDVATNVAQVNKMLSGETDTYARDKRYIRKDGSVLWVVLSVSCVRRLDRSVEYTVAIVKDITERKQAEAALRASEEHQRNLLDNLDAGVVVHAPDTSIVQSNVRAGVALGLTTDQMRGKVAVDPGWRFVREDGSPMPLPEYPVNQVVASGSPVVGQVIGIDRPVTGDRAWALVNAYPEFDEARALRQVVVTFVDITSRKEAEQALRRSEAMYAAMARSYPGGAIGLFDRDLRYVLIDGKGVSLTGVPPATLAGHTVFEIYPSAHHEDIAAAFRTALAGETKTFELSVRGKVMEIQCGPVADRDGKVILGIATSRDITDRRHAEVALRASEARFRALAEEAPIGIYQFDAIGRSVYLNRVGQIIVGRTQEEAASMGWSDALHPEDRDRVLREFADAIAAGEEFESDYRFLHRDGTTVLVHGNATAIHDESSAATSYIGVVMDVTKVKVLEAKVALNSHLAALGTLVAGVAHEINNPLTAEIADQGLAVEVVREIRERLRGDSPLDREADGRALDDVVEALEDAQKSSHRIAQIVKDLSSFGRPDSKRERCRLNDILDGAVRWLPGRIAASASVRVENDGAPDVVASPGQIEQVVVNLITNAAKATPEGQRDTVIVRVGPGLSGMARLEVIDHGCGIDHAIRDRIFEPFFTTRPSGSNRGSGLGLAICHAIVTAHGGTLTVQSEVGKGSTFTLELPAAPVEG